MGGGTKTPTREPTAPGVGTKEREAPAAPVITVAPTRERTVLGVGGPQPAPKSRAVMPSAPEPPPEDGWDAASVEQVATKAEGAPALDRSLPIALVPAKSKIAAATAPSEASLAAAGLPRRRRRRWLAVLVVLVAAGCAAYFMRARIPWLGPIIERGAAWIAAQRH